MTGNNGGKLCIFLLHPEKSKLTSIPKRHFSDIDESYSKILPIPYLLKALDNNSIMLNCSDLVQWLESEVEYTKKELELESGIGLRKIQGKLEAFEKVIDYIRAEKKGKFE